MSEIPPEEWETTKYVLTRKGCQTMGDHALVLTVMYQGGLSGEELARFCLRTPNGQELYAQYKAYWKRARERGEKDYDYIAYAREILAENPDPIA